MSQESYAIEQLARFLLGRSRYGHKDPVVRPPENPGTEIARIKTMTQPRDIKSALRAAGTMSELEKARRSMWPSAIGALARVALAVVYMYLIVIAYDLMGISGPIFISVLFLIALYAPHAYQTFIDQMGISRAPRAPIHAPEEPRQET